VDGDAVVLLHVWRVVLPDGSDDDVVTATVKLHCDQTALDLGAADERRVIVGGEENAHKNLRHRPLTRGPPHVEEPATSSFDAPRNASSRRIL
jgi:hypothetical protein